MLLGHWKNIAELEENLSLDELEAIVTAAREAKRQDQIFAAALKGIDLEESEEQNKNKFEQVQKRAEAILQNKTDSDVERDDFAELGIEFEED